MIATTYEIFYIHPHIYELARVYPFDCLNIAHTWKQNNYCSMIKLEYVLKDIIKFNSGKKL